MKRTPREAPPSEKRPNPGRIRAIILAVAVHALFIAIIVFGVTWQSAPTAPVQAEIWDKLPPVKPNVAQAPAPKPPPEPPKPAPEPPKPVVKPPPPKPEPKVEPPKPDPEIALKAEREKRQKAEQEKRQKLEREKAERENAQKKREEQERKQEAEQMKREEEARQRQIQEQQAVAERARAAAASARQNAINEWRDKISAKIRGRANVPATVPKGTKVQVLIHILPGGEVLDIAITKRSGNAAYDDAIERAIRSASPLPVPPPNSELFPQFRELSLNLVHEG